jgi:hypothetical protein
MYLFYEDLFKAETLDKLWKFLGIEGIDAQTQRRSNLGRHADLPEEAEAILFHALREQYEVVFERFGCDVPDAWRARYESGVSIREGWISKFLNRYRS